MITSSSGTHVVWHGAGRVRTAKRGPQVKRLLERRLSLNVGRASSDSTGCQSQPPVALPSVSLAKAASLRAENGTVNRWYGVFTHFLLQEL